ncbi:hypothetical protein ACFFUT_02670 [Pseudohalocynthiibacter aestuariivivens]|jgi:hypothetical protein|uniref:AAA+ family ATPase n=1 Tax=Pseudohalocynthiibacter aestuariivivens TaxID=1591409 RepID=A0ABV5JB70_9RHOB|nr:MULTISPECIES: hypothetical protein [Pseudohalocynthiibacter]MBS9715755.1 hypothetical protein [Pseudohalocynthiibacter aestuariivivens]MCK0101368.1 hypothetical protein [Pseudohalocynthiibacter sp. F2068]
MKHIAALALVASISVTPVYSQDNDVEEGFSLMEEGAKILLRSLLQEMEPAIKDLHGFAQEMAPVMRELQGMIGDFGLYHLPEILPNGDIIIRRKTPEEIAEPKGDDVEI